MTITTTLEQGRAAFAQRAWSAAFAYLSAADQETPLEPADLECLAICTHLLGRDADCDALWERAHRGLIARNDVEAAARCAFWLSFGLQLRGEMAQAGGWLARAQRLLDENDITDSAVRGYL